MMMLNLKRVLWVIFLINLSECTTTSPTTPAPEKTGSESGFNLLFKVLAIGLAILFVISVVVLGITLYKYRQQKNGNPKSNKSKKSVRSTKKPIKSKVSTSSKKSLSSKSSSRKAKSLAKQPARSPASVTKVSFLTFYIG